MHNTITAFLWVIRRKIKLRTSTLISLSVMYIEYGLTRVQVTRVKQVSRNNSDFRQVVRGFSSHLEKKKNTFGAFKMLAVDGVVISF